MKKQRLPAAGPRSAFVSWLCTTIAKPWTNKLRKSRPP